MRLHPESKEDTNLPDMEEKVSSLPDNPTNVDRVLQVRVLEAAGLLRSTNFALKNVTIHKPLCALQLRNIYGSHSTRSVKRTKTAKRTLFPVWDESFSFSLDQKDYCKSDRLNRPIIRIHVQGYDPVHPVDLGLVDIPIENIKRMSENHIFSCYQGWFLLDKRTPPRSSVAGKIFISFRMIEKASRWGGPSRGPPTISCLEESKEDENLGIFIGTMNCGNAKQPDEKLIKKWLDCDHEKHKIVVVGLQECAWDKQANEELIWQNAIKSAINDWVKNRVKMFEFQAEMYELLAVHSLGEMRIYCFVQEKSLRLNKVCNVSKFNEATGIGGVWNNKGATLISFDYGGTSLCFANSHLAAHQTKFIERNKNYQEICNLQGIGNIKHDIVEQFHYFFWLGDLNYRCDWGQEENPQDSPEFELFEAYMKKIDSKSYLELLDKDQLSNVLKTEKPKQPAFFGFEEGPINFQPTFKVHRSPQFHYIQRRTPAWCDRILYRSAPGYGVKCERYDCVPEIDTSDHKPVFGSFSVKTWARQPAMVDLDGRTINSENDKKTATEIIFRNCCVKPRKHHGENLYIYFPQQELLETQLSFPPSSAGADGTCRYDEFRMSLWRTNPRFLENALLLFQCRDQDRFRVETKVGSGYLSLKPLVKDLRKFETKRESSLQLPKVEPLPEWYKIEQNYLTKDGVYAAVFSGECCLNTTSETVRSRGYSISNFMSSLF